MIVGIITMLMMIMELAITIITAGIGQLQSMMPTTMEMLMHIHITIVTMEMIIIIMKMLTAAAVWSIRVPAPTYGGGQRHSIVLVNPLYRAAKIPSPSEIQSVNLFRWL